MQRHLLVIGLIGASCSAAFSQSPAENDLYEKLSEEGPGSVKALETVLKNSDECPFFILYEAAIVAFGEGRLEDCGFLFYAAKLRANFDDKCFPPKGTGGANPFILVPGMEFSFGPVILPEVMAKPKAFQAAVERLRAWIPKAPERYHPGYEFTERKPDDEAYEAVKADHAEFLDGMSGLAVLLNDTEYFAAFRVVQAYNFEAGDKRPPKEAHDKAMVTMRRIEEEKGLKGFSKVPEDSPANERPEAIKGGRTGRCARGVEKKRPARRGPPCRGRHYRYGLQCFP